MKEEQFNSDGVFEIFHSLDKIPRNRHSYHRERDMHRLDMQISPHGKVNANDTNWSYILF